MPCRVFSNTLGFSPLHVSSIAPPHPNWDKMTPDIAKGPPRSKATPGREPLFKKNEVELSNQACIMQVSQSAYGLHIPVFLLTHFKAM